MTTDKQIEELLKPKEILAQAIEGAPLVWAAITEAVHRYYWDNVLDKRRNVEAVKFASDLLTNLWCLHPNWRLTLRQKADSYKEAETTNLEVSGNPSKTITVSLNTRFLTDIIQDNYRKAWIDFKKSEEYKEPERTLKLHGVPPYYRDSVLKIAFTAGWIAAKTKEEQP